MELVLQERDFVNDRFTVSYGGNKEALFTIVDEEFSGYETEVKINRVLCLARTIASDGTPSTAKLCGLIWGFGDTVVGAKNVDASLRGKFVTRADMSSGTVVLYEA